MEAGKSTKYSTSIKEEELKNKVAKDWFDAYDTTRIIGNIDFTVAKPKAQDGQTVPLLWAEAKAGSNHSTVHSLVQLILTIGKARTFNKVLPPPWLAAFDCQKIAFVSYHAVSGVFFQNDFDWNVTPSDHGSKEFQQLTRMVEDDLRQNMRQYDWLKDEPQLRSFIAQNMVTGSAAATRQQVDKNNFTFIYQRWREEVMDTIQVDWEKAKKAGLLDADFFLADLLSSENKTLKDKLYVLLEHDHYQFDRKIDDLGFLSSKTAVFYDQMAAHTAFWNKYERPPRREYWDYIVERRDLQVPQDVRERKGSFFTPHRWVELSQQYLARELGDDWQDEYYIWDCCAGTGNLLAGLVNRDHIWASTLDKADVDVMKDRIRNGAALYENHVFQFDFLNDSFDRLPQELLGIINTPEKRKKLIIYINPPYAEATTATTVSGTGKNKAGVATDNAMFVRYKKDIGKAGKELFAQFFIRIYREIPDSILAEFSTLKILQASNFSDFRRVFNADLRRAFLVPADTFDNVKGQFPIGFFIWNLGEGTKRRTAYSFDVFDAQGRVLQKKQFHL